MKINWVKMSLMESVWSFLVRIVKIWSFWGKNDVIDQNLEKLGKIILYNFLKSISIRLMGMNFVKNVINWVNLLKICILWCFSYISQLKSLYQFYKNIVNYPCSTTFQRSNQDFSKPQGPYASNYTSLGGRDRKGIIILKGKAVL